MFWVRDKQDARHERIRRLVTRDDAGIAVLVAAADFEWTIRRGILALGRSSTRRTKEQMQGAHGLDRYKEVWSSEVAVRDDERLPRLIKDWKYFRTEAFPLRNRLVHGITGTVGVAYARDRVESVLGASIAITQFARDRGYDLYARLSVRRDPPGGIAGLRQAAMTGRVRRSR